MTFLPVKGAGHGFGGENNIAPVREFLARVFAVVLAVWQVASVLSFGPHVLPYVNELVLDRKLTYRTIADSNVD